MAWPMFLSKSEKAFLFFFIPLFGLKFIDVTSDNILLKLFGVACFLFALWHILDMNYGKKVFNTLATLLVYSAILVLTCGKQAAFFTVVMLVLMFKVNMDRNVYPILLKVGVFFLLLGVLYTLTHEAQATTRYVNGEWVEMAKRSNIIYVNYLAVVSLLCLVYRQYMSVFKIIAVVVVGYYMYLFSGSRSGFVLVSFWALMLLIFRIRWVRDNYIVKYLCILSPLFCMLFCIYTGWAYEKHAWLTILDMLLQGRVSQNSIFLHDYNILPFGQRIVEGSEIGGVFLNLDCAYLDMLICEGLIFAILWTVTTIAVIKYYYQKGKMIEVSLLVMYAFYGITETFLPNCFLNISLFLYGEYLYKVLKIPPKIRSARQRLLSSLILLRLRNRPKGCDAGKVFL